MKEYIVQAIAQETIDSFDAHNAPELIRCKDCKFWNNDGIITICEKHIGNGYPGDWFCADGERMADNA